MPPFGWKSANGVRSSTCTKRHLSLLCRDGLPWLCGFRKRRAAPIVMVQDAALTRIYPAPHDWRDDAMSDANTKRTQAAGPLVVSRENPRYIAVAHGADAGRAVYLTGSHIWNNFHDGLGPGGACVSPPEINDYGHYLDFLAE